MTKGEGKDETERRITWKERHTVTSHNALSRSFHAITKSPGSSGSRLIKLCLLPGRCNLEGKPERIKINQREIEIGVVPTSCHDLKIFP